MTLTAPACPAAQSLPVEVRDKAAASRRDRREGRGRVGSAVDQGHDVRGRETAAGALVGLVAGPAKSSDRVAGRSLILHADRSRLLDLRLPCVRRLCGHRAVGIAIAGLGQPAQRRPPPHASRRDATRRLSMHRSSACRSSASSASWPRRRPTQTTPDGDRLKLSFTVQVVGQAPKIDFLQGFSVDGPDAVRLADPPGSARRPHAAGVPLAGGARSRRLPSGPRRSCGRREEVALRRGARRIQGAGDAGRRGRGAALHAVIAAPRCTAAGVDASRRPAMIALDGAVRILIAAATAAEIAPLVDAIRPATTHDPRSAFADASRVTTSMCSSPASAWSRPRSGRAARARARAPTTSPSTSASCGAFDRRASAADSRARRLGSRCPSSAPRTATAF